MTKREIFIKLLEDWRNLNGKTIYNMSPSEHSARENIEADVKIKLYEEKYDEAE